jgi:hypothetical protein
MRKKILLSLALACACAAAAMSAAVSRAADPTQGSDAATNDPSQQPVHARRTVASQERYLAAVHWLGSQIASYQQMTWKWQRLMGRPLTETEGRRLGEMSIPDVKGALELWRRRANAARLAASHPPHLTAWLCIHRYEGSWTDDGAPYYGGLQMDYGFMAHYGAFLLRVKGPASKWSPLEQMWVAERALASGRSFAAWPNSARICGLL